MPIHIKVEFQNTDKAETVSVRRGETKAYSGIYRKTSLSLTGGLVCYAKYKYKHKR